MYIMMPPINLCLLPFLLLKPEFVSKHRAMWWYYFQRSLLFGVLTVHAVCE